MSAEDELIADISRYCDDPLGYAHYAFPWMERDGELAESPGPRIWQAEMLDTIGQHLRGPDRYKPLRIAVASGHGIGKSANIGQIIQWAMSTCDDCRVIVTANTGDQLKTKTIPEVSKWFRMAINAHWFKVGGESIRIVDEEHAKTWRTDFLTWSLERPESFAGLHNRGKRIVVIFDEASAIPDKIWEVVEGALTDEDTEIIVICYGNPTMTSGRFRECFGSRKHRWVTRQIDSRTVEGTNKAEMDGWVADYGEDSDFVRVRVRGEFPRAGSAQFIPSDLVAAARKRKAVGYENEWKIISVDVARFGDDQTVIGLRQGPKFSILARVRGLSIPQTSMRVMAAITEHNPRGVIIDGDGIGGGVVDYVALHHAQWIASHPLCRFVEFHGGHAPTDGYMYFNRRAEVWGMLKDWLKTAEIPDDPEIETDLTAPEYSFSAKNQIQLEKKDDMKKRGVASPDNGDTLAMSFAAYTPGKSQEERDREKIAAAPNDYAKVLLQYKITHELEARQARLEERRPEHWE